MSDTIEQCQDYCLAETAFYCKSFDYKPSDKTCLLSKVNQHDDGITINRDLNDAYIY